MSLFADHDDVAERARACGMTATQYMQDAHKTRRGRLVSSRQDREATERNRELRMAALANAALERRRQWRESWRRMVMMAIDEQIQAARTTLSAKAILLEVSRWSGISVLDLTSDRRAKPIVNARHCYFWRARNETARSLPYIGKLAGGRDHTTVLHGIRRFQSALDAGEQWAVDLVEGRR